MAQVAGVLLDHVQVDQAQRHDLSAMGERVVQRRVGHGRVGQLELLGQPGIVGGGPGRVGPLEVGARIVAERVVDRLAREALPEPLKPAGITAAVQFREEGLGPLVVKLPDFIEQLQSESRASFYGENILCRNNATPEPPRLR